MNDLEVLTASVVWIQDQEPDQTGMGMGLDEGRGYLMFPVLVVESTPRMVWARTPPPIMTGVISLVK